MTQRHISDKFEDVIILWSDEASVQLEMHKRHCYRNVGERPTPKPRSKHPTKVHVRTGISTQRVTKICIFQGIMDAEFYHTHS